MAGTAWRVLLDMNFLGDYGDQQFLMSGVSAGAVLLVVTVRLSYG